MRSLLFFVLASYAVRCDDTSYYVIEMPEENPPTRYYRKPFKVYWNVPTMQCTSKKIPFENLYERFGIIQNKNDSFRGEEITILYDPGLFPALLKNETSGKFKFRNGGVPQEGSLEKHIATFKSTMENSIPDPDFSGIGIIDFESWRPVFRQNFGVLVPYKDISYEIEKKLHWWWPKQWLQSEAQQRFEEAARTFMQTTLSVAKQMRPNAVWGYYGFPYCFNMASNNKYEACANKVPQENDGMYWLWAESTALYPSVYSSKDLTTAQLAALIRGRIKEAARVKRRNTPILPYFWFRYRDGGYLSEVDLNMALHTMYYKSNASGFIVWGSSKDVNTVDKCKQLKKYIENVFGPAIAQYTNTESKLENEILNAVTDIEQNPISPILSTTTTTISSVLANENKIIITNDTKTSTTPDPEYHWEPPENYTHDIAQYVKDELNKNPKYNDSLEENVTTTNPNTNMYTDSVLLSTLLDSIENITESTSDFSTNKNENRNISTTEVYYTSTTDYSTSKDTSEYDIETTTVIDLSTIINMKLNKNPTKESPISQTTDSSSTKATSEYSYTDTESNTTPVYTEDYEQNMYNLYLNDTSLENSEENYTTTQNIGTTEPVLVNINEYVSKNKKKGYAKETTYEPTDTVATSTEPYKVETSTHLNDVTDDFSDKNRKKGISRTTKYNDTDTNDTRPGVHTVFVQQVAASTASDRLPFYLFHISVFLLHL